MPLGYVVKRVLQLILILLGVSVLVFLMLRLIPGDSARLLLGEFASPAELGRLRTQLGLDQSVMTQYGIYMSRILHGDFGNSVRTGAPIVGEIGVRFLATIELSVAAMLIAVILGISAGVISAVWQYSILDYGAMVLALIGVSMPIFWLGLMLIYVFAVKIPILPMMGRISMGVDIPAITGLLIVDTLLAGQLSAFGDAVRHLILPSITLATIPMAVVARMTRSSMLEVLNRDYVRTARAKGMDESVVILRHALRNAFLPVVTIIGLNFGLLLGGAVLTETIFSWPGLGRYVVDSLMARDYAAVQGCILMFSLVMAVSNLMVDLVYLLLDPRIRIHE